MFDIKVKILLSAALALGATATWADAPRRAPAETAAATVSLSDLDLSTAAGMEAARLRIAAMALHLCRRFDTSRRIDDRENTDACYHEAVAAALGQVGAQTRVANQPTRPLRHPQ